MSQGKAEADLALWPGDLVVIPSAARIVYVLGAVNKPGNFEIPTDTRLTLSMAVSSAGSYTRFAATSRIQVLRQPPGGKPQKSCEAQSYGRKLSGTGTVPSGHRNVPTNNKRRP